MIDKNVFKIIEDILIVRHSHVFPADNIGKNEGGIEHVAVKKASLATYSYS